MTVLFRADSSSTIGTGHIMRDLVLAKQYKDANIIFATQDLQGNINAKIADAGYNVEILKDNSFDAFQKVIDKYSPNLIVIDSYDINYDYELKIKTTNPTLKLLSFDDTYEKHYCDILLNHNISADEKRYKGLVPEYCDLRCGKKYTLLRNEFIEQKKSKSIFLAMGGADSTEVNIPILKILSEFNNIKVNLVTTTANGNIEELKAYVKKRKWIKLHINSTKIAKLMKKSDLAIITPSVTANEIVYMELDLIAIMVAENQKDMYRYFNKNAYSVLKKFNKKKLINQLLKKGVQ